MMNTDKRSKERKALIQAGFRNPIYLCRADDSYFFEVSNEYQTKAIACIEEIDVTGKYEIGVLNSKQEKDIRRSLLIGRITNMLIIGLGTAILLCWLVPLIMWQVFHRIWEVFQ